MSKLNQLSIITSLETTMQRWAELCTQQAKKEIPVELKWYLKGRAEAHAMDAERARCIAHPTAKIEPSGEDPFTPAYRAALKLMTEFAGSRGEEEE